MNEKTFYKVYKYTFILKGNRMNQTKLQFFSYVIHIYQYLTGSRKEIRYFILLPFYTVLDLVLCIIKHNIFTHEKKK